MSTQQEPNRSGFGPGTTRPTVSPRRLAARMRRRNKRIARGTLIAFLALWAVVILWHVGKAYRARVTRSTASVIEPVSPPPPKPAPGEDGALEARIEAWEKAGSTEAYARELLDRGYAKEAENAIRQALAVNPGHLELLALLAETLQRQGNLRGAEEPLTEALTGDPERLDDRIALAALLHRLNRPKDALLMAQWALDAKPASIPALRIMAEIHSQNGSSREALLALRRIIASDPNDREALLSIARIMTQRGDYAAAIEVYNRLIDKQLDTDPVWYYELANGYVLRGMTTHAEETLKAAGARHGNDRVKEWLAQTPAFADLNVEMEVDDVESEIVTRREIKQPGVRSALLESGSLIPSEPGDRFRTIVPMR